MTIVMVTLVVYFVVMIVIGFIGNKKTDAKNLNDMFVADGTLSPFIIFITSTATAFSAFAFLGAPSAFYSSGVTSVLWMAPIVADLTFMAIVARGMWLLAKRYNFVTPADLLSARFDYKKDKTVRFIVAIMCLFFCGFYIQLNITGSGYVIETVTGGVISYEVGLIIVAVIIGFYTMMGGARSVAWSDTAQAILLIGALAVISVIAVINGGGADMFDKIMEIAPAVGNIETSKLYAYTCMLGVAASMPVWPSMWVRCYTGRNFKGTVIGFVQGEGVGVLFTCILFPALIGGAGILLFPGLVGTEADNITVMYFQYVPDILAGLFAIGALAAAMSTADAITLLLGSIVVKDIIDPFKPQMKDTHKANISRIACVLVIGVSLAIAFNPPGTLVEMAFAIAWPGAACFFPLVVGTIFWKRATREGAIIGLIMAVSAAALTTFVWPSALNIYASVWAILAGGGGLIVGSLLTPAPPEHIVTMFHGFLKETYKYKGISDKKDVMAISVPGEKK